MNQGAFFLLGFVSTLTHNYTLNEKNSTYQFSGIVLLQLYGTGATKKVEPTTNTGQRVITNQADEYGKWLVGRQPLY